MTLTVGPPVALSPLQVAAPVTLRSLTVGAAVTLPVLTVQADGQRVWTADGPPDVVPGAEPNDLYLDELTGTLYRLT